MSTAANIFLGYQCAEFSHSRLYILHRRHKKTADGYKYFQRTCRKSAIIGPEFKTMAMM